MHVILIATGSLSELFHKTLAIPCMDIDIICGENVGALMNF